MAATTIHGHGFWNDRRDEKEAECLDKPEDPSIGIGFPRLPHLDQEHLLYAGVRSSMLNQKIFHQKIYLLNYLAKFFSFKILKKLFSKLQIST